MIEIPDNVRQWLAILRKYHFWILAAVVPALLLPLLSMGNSGLQAEIAARKREIDGKLGQVRSVTGVSPHPNRRWSDTIEGQANEVDKETRREWQRLWESQASLRVWPPELGPEFLAAVAALGPRDRLDRQALLNYQRRVPRFARSLPARMGVPEQMDATRASGGPGDESQPAGPRPPCIWSQADQQRLAKSFSWGRPPTTEQVLLAQQELWVYGVFCDIIRGLNAKATGLHDVPMVFVEQLAVGYPAAEEAPGGRGVGRIFVPPPPVAARGGQDSFGGPEGDFPDNAGNAGEGEGNESAVPERFVRPPHPRFTDSREAAGLPEEQWNWAYVDFAGQPLLGSELAAAPGIDMVRLMPFVLNVVMDEREVDRLLATLAEWPVPIDVRQVRINPGSAGGQGSGGRQRGDETFARKRPDPGGRQRGGRPDGQGDELASPRRYDVIVELRGSVALATPPGSAPASPAGATDGPRSEAF